MLLAEHGDEAKVLAGGQSLVPLLNFRLARPRVLVDIASVAEWTVIRDMPGKLSLGALTTHLRIEQGLDDDMFRGLDVLPRTAPYIGHLPIRTRGTIGGSLSHGDSAAEWCVLAKLLDAEVTVCSIRGERRISAANLFRGFLETDIAPDEVLTSVAFPRTGNPAVLVEHAPRHGDFALASVAVTAEVDGRVCRHPRIVLGGIAAVPLRAHAAEEVLAGRVLTAPVAAAAAAAAAAAIDPPTDVHASSEHRRRLVRALLPRALNKLIVRSKENAS